MMIKYTPSERDAYEEELKYQRDLLMIKESALEGGEARGQTKGKNEGKIEGKAEVISQLLTLRFGSQTPSDLEQKLQLISNASSFLELAMTCQSIDEFMVY